MEKHTKKAASPDENPEDGGQPYDNIIKERLRDAVPSLMIFLGLLPEGRIENINVEFPRTRMRRADFLAKHFGKKGEKTILHAEFQAGDDTKMLPRELDYCAQIHFDYPDFDIVQVVFAIGPKKPKMKTSVKFRFFEYGYKLFWIKEIPYKLLMEAEKPELLLLAAFADYGGRPAAAVFEEVILSAKKRFKSAIDYDTFTGQLHIFSNLHNLQQIFKNVMIEIFKNLDASKDPYFKDGKKLGKLEGKLEVCFELIKTTDWSDVKIAQTVKLKSEQVTTIRAIIEAHPDNSMALAMNLFEKAH